jgi:hypothetical protein
MWYTPQGDCFSLSTGIEMGFTLWQKYRVFREPANPIQSTNQRGLFSKREQKKSLRAECTQGREKRTRRKRRKESINGCCVRGCR